VIRTQNLDDLFIKYQITRDQLTSATKRFAGDPEIDKLAKKLQLSTN